MARGSKNFLGVRDDPIGFWSLWHSGFAYCVCAETWQAGRFDASDNLRCLSKSVDEFGMNLELHRGHPA